MELLPDCLRPLYGLCVLCILENRSMEENYAHSTNLNFPHMIFVFFCEEKNFLSGVEKVSGSEGTSINLSVVSFFIFFIAWNLLRNKQQQMSI